MAATSPQYPITSTTTPSRIRMSCPRPVSGEPHPNRENNKMHYHERWLSYTASVRTSARSIEPTQVASGNATEYGSTSQQSQSASFRGGRQYYRPDGHILIRLAWKSPWVEPSLLCAPGCLGRPRSTRFTLISYGWKP